MLRIGFCLVLIGLCFGVFAQTDWEAATPVFVDNVTTTRLGASSLAVGPSGNLAAIWTRTSGESYGQAHYSNRVLPLSRSSEVYVAFSNDYGTSWSAPTRMSNPQYLCSEVSAAAGKITGEFYFAWTSGDVFSGHRLHTATTLDGGDTFSTSTRTQSFLDLDQGYIFPRLTASDSHQILSWGAARQDIPTKPYNRYLTTTGLGQNTWSETHALDIPASSTDFITFDSPMATDGTNVVAVGSSRNAGNSLYYPIVQSRSTNGGTSWSEVESVNVAPYTGLVSRRPSVATDRNGTWLLMYYGGGATTHTQFLGRLLVQVSNDAGATWSAPQLHMRNVSPSNSDISIAGNGNGQWIAVINSVNYIWSEDNGQTWTDHANIPTNAKLQGHLQCHYLGNGKWGIIGGKRTSAQWPWNDEISFSIMQWGESAVEDWTLY